MASGEWEFVRHDACSLVPPIMAIAGYRASGARSGAVEFRAVVRGLARPIAAACLVCGAVYLDFLLLAHFVASLWPYLAVLLTALAIVNIVASRRLGRRVWHWPGNRLPLD